MVLSSRLTGHFHAFFRLKTGRFRYQSNSRSEFAIKLHNISCRGSQDIFNTFFVVFSKQSRYPCNSRSDVFQKIRKMSKKHPKSAYFLSRLTWHSLVFFHLFSGRSRYHSNSRSEFGLQNRMIFCRGSQDILRYFFHLFANQSRYHSNSRSDEFLKFRLSMLIFVEAQLHLLFSTWKRPIWEPRGKWQKHIFISQKYRKTHNLDPIYQREPYTLL